MEQTGQLHISQYEDIKKLVKESEESYLNTLILKEDAEKLMNGTLEKYPIRKGFVPKEVGTRGKYDEFNKALDKMQVGEFIPFFDEDEAAIHAAHSNSYGKKVGKVFSKHGTTIGRIK